MSAPYFALFVLAAFVVDGLAACLLALAVTRIQREHQRRAVTREAERVLVEWKREHA